MLISYGKHSLLERALTPGQEFAILSHRINGSDSSKAVFFSLFVHLPEYPEKKVK